MSAKEQRKLQRGIRREAKKVAPGIVKLINGSPLAWRIPLAFRILFGTARLGDLFDTEHNVHLAGGENREHRDLA